MHPWSCAKCRPGIAERGWGDPRHADCGGGESPVRAEGHGDGFFCPVAIARSHWRACVRCRQAAAEGFDLRDPDTWTDPACATGVVGTTLAAALFPMEWIKGEADFRRTPGHLLRAPVDLADADTATTAAIAWPKLPQGA